mgnify:CR=1 FL=1
MSAEPDKFYYQYNYWAICTITNTEKLPWIHFYNFCCDDKRDFIGLTTIKLRNFTAYLNKRPSTNRIVQKRQSILTSSTDGQFPIWPSADMTVASGGVCSFIAMTTNPHPPDTSSMYRTPVKRSKNISCSQKKLPMNNPKPSFSKCKEYHSILYIVTIENNKLYAAATTRKNRIALLEMNKIFICTASNLIWQKPPFWWCVCQT